VGCCSFTPVTIFAVSLSCCVFWNVWGYSETSYFVILDALPGRWDDDSLRAGVVLWERERGGRAGFGGREETESEIRVTQASRGGGRVKAVGLEGEGGGRNTQKVVFLLNWDDSSNVVDTFLLASCFNCVLVDFWYGIFDDSNMRAGGGGGGGFPSCGGGER